MIPTTFGDMTQSLSFGRHNARLKSTLTTLSQEMTTGQARDKVRHLGGNVTALAAMEKSLELATDRKGLAQTTAALLAGKQSIVLDISHRTEQVALEAMRLELDTDPAAIKRTMDSFADAFSGVVRSLNTRFGERTLFAGTRGDGPALAQPEAILDALVSDLPVPLDPSALSGLVEAWFAPASGFDSLAYLGGAPVPAPIDLGHGAEINLTATAQDSAVRKTLAALATGAVLTRELPGLGPAEHRAIIHQSSLPLKSASQGLLDLSARLGVAEERAATASSRAEAERTSLSIALTELLAVDPYESASKLEQVMSQLDMIYAITARLSRLSLADYLR